MSKKDATKSPTPEDKEATALENEEAAKEENIMNEFPPLEEETVLKCRNATIDDIMRTDTDIVVKGMDLFFNNEFQQAEDLFSKHFKDDPLCASAYGTTGTVRAMLSMEPQDIDIACKRLVYASHFGKKVIPAKGAISSMTTAIGNWWYSRKPEKLSPADFRANVVMGEAELLRANLLLMEDTISGYLKAGLALRRAYNMYDYLQKYIGHYPDDHGVDANSLNGMHFGLGAIHVVTSILPPKILNVLKALGYMHDRVKGFEHLHTCLKSRTLRSPIASLFLLAFHGMLPAFATLTTEVNIPIAEQVITETLAVYPKSVIHLWIAGRVQRLKKDVTGSINVFSDCVGYSATLEAKLPQLKHFAQYDLAWSYCGKGQWENARICFEVLERESVWSKKFYAYAQGCCLDQMEKYDEAAACYIRSSTSPSIKLGGKTISVDQFVKRRTELMFRLRRTSTGVAPGSPKAPKLTESINLTKAPGLELAMMFNMYTQMEAEDIEMFYHRTNEALHNACKKYNIDLPDHLPPASEADAASPKPGQTPTAVDDDEADQHDDEDDDDLAPYTEAEVSQLQHEEILVLLLMKSTLLRERTEYADACAGYDAVQKPQRINLNKATFETWLAPHAFYEHAVALYRQGEVAECSDMVEKLKKKYNGLDYNYEMQMQFRLHLTKDMLNEQEKAAKAKK